MGSATPQNQQQGMSTKDCDSVGVAGKCMGVMDVSIDLKQQVTAMRFLKEPLINLFRGPDSSVVLSAGLSV
jgi:hypothetical protein